MRIGCACFTKPVELNLEQVTTETVRFKWHSGLFQQTVLAITCNLSLPLSTGHLPRPNSASIGSFARHSDLINDRQTQFTNTWIPLTSYLSQSLALTSFLPYFFLPSLLTCLVPTYLPAHISTSLLKSIHCTLVRVISPYILETELQKSKQSVFQMASGCIDLFTYLRQRPVNPSAISRRESSHCTQFSLCHHLKLFVRIGDTASRLTLTRLCFFQLASSRLTSSKPACFAAACFF